jgi:putative ABC transport system substrate-binding protein
MAQPIHVLRATSADEIDAAFTELAREAAKALLVADDPFFSARRAQIVSLAARHAVPAIYYAREFPADGGLISYGSSATDNYHQAGVYVGRILKGAKATDLPVVQPTQFSLVLNMNTARALGLSVPPTLLARADEVIE